MTQPSMQLDDIGGAAVDPVPDGFSAIQVGQLIADGKMSDSFGLK